MTDKPKKNKGGRPRKPINKEEVLKDLEEGVTKKDAYKKQGRDPNKAIAGLEKYDPQFGKQVKESTQAFLEREVFPKKAFIVSAFWEKIAAGDTSAIIYGMKTIVGLKEGRTIEVSGEVQHIHSLTAEQRKAKIDELRTALDQAIDVEILESDDDA